MSTLTKKQKEVFDFIKGYNKKRGVSPTFEEIRKHFKKAIGTIHEHIEELVKKGFLKKTNSARGIEIIKNLKDYIELPLLGTIAAGQPIEVVEEQETIQIPRALVPNRQGQFFALKVKGDSMIDDGILNGDTIIAESSSTANNGELIVALTPDNEATLKYFYKEKNRIRLEPRNPAYEPIYLKKLNIQGKFINLLRQPAPVLVKEPTGPIVEREKLEKKYDHLLSKKFDYRRLVTYVPNKKMPIYNWFPYKEGFSRDLVRNILDEHKIAPGAWILDPFGGCGTTALACEQFGYNSTAIDIMPISVFVTNVKLRPPNEYNLDKLAKAIDNIANTNYVSPKSTLPNIPIIKKAFPEKTQKELIFYKEKIATIKDEIIRDFLLLGLLSILVDVSNTSKDGQYLRIVEKKIPPVKDVLIRKLASMLADLTQQDKNDQITLFTNEKKKVKIGHAEAIMGDARKLPLKTNKFDAVITSPPYLNRYDYSRIYALELGLNFVKNADDLKKIRHSLLRSHIEVKPAPTNDVAVPALIEILDNLNLKELNNPRIPIMIRGYFEDMKLAIEEMYRVCKSGAFVALVVGNVRFEGEIVPVDLILSEIAEKAGFKTLDIWATRYKGNSSQQMGKYGRLPVRESIAFWKKL